MNYPKILQEIYAQIQPFAQEGHQADYIPALNPGRYSVAVWSPRLNGKGNSVMGMKALELLTTRTSDSIF